MAIYRKVSAIDAAPYGFQSIAEVEPRVTPEAHKMGVVVLKGLVESVKRVESPIQGSAFDVAETQMPPTRQNAS